ncbi:hypothetical protein [Fibrobacter sp. HC4]|uniref:hypothetical protein n=1 Tax=Fibrobacter sp. HC4 TaxID=3239812 RepID=UPI0020196911|nr:hypothetical protein [Fibrobacter succinogenes]MCL4103158.1 hypothetical protein [Fibrobacter succinogenes]
MKFRIISLILIVSAFLLSGCVTEGDPRISKIRMEVNPAPEMRGAGEHMTSDYQVRLSGGLNAGPSKKMEVDDVYHNGRSVDFAYSLEYGFVNAAAELALKKNIFMVNTGVGINNGLYTFASLGLNTSHFEIGFSGGVWMNHRDYDCEGDMELEDVPFSPRVYTLYASASYRLNDHWRVRLGSVGVHGENFDKRYWSGFGGVSYWL